MDTVLPDPPLAPRLVVGAAIVDDLDRPTRLLAARRTGPPALAGGWELPGGKVDPGEDASPPCTARSVRSSACWWSSARRCPGRWTGPGRWVTGT